MPIEIPTQAKLDRWAERVAGMPADVQAVAKRFDPWGRYRMTDTNQIVRIERFDPDCTLLVWIDPEFNDPDDWRTGYQVFGVNPDDLEPWHPPLNG